MNGNLSCSDDHHCKIQTQDHDLLTFWGIYAQIAAFWGPKEYFWKKLFKCVKTNFKNVFEILLLIRFYFHKETCVLVHVLYRVGHHNFRFSKSNKTQNLLILCYSVRKFLKFIYIVSEIRSGRGSWVKPPLSIQCVWHFLVFILFISEWLCLHPPIWPHVICIRFLKSSDYLNHPRTLQEYWKQTSVKKFGT